MGIILNILSYVDVLAECVHSGIDFQRRPECQRLYEII